MKMVPLFLKVQAKGAHATGMSPLWRLAQQMISSRYRHATEIK